MGRVGRVLTDQRTPTEARPVQLQGESMAKSKVEMPHIAKDSTKVRCKIAFREASDNPLTGELRSPGDTWDTTFAKAISWTKLGLVEPFDLGLAADAPPKPTAAEVIAKELPDVKPMTEIPALEDVIVPANIGQKEGLL